eukprot:CAMPEP_0167761294 /NCGR_PEP_ID=MMETSP0110_2-20121227/12087_1 /TAXON_ID=629695 /ORGANISM="Gymnochlora sp., Strain CCMP2014" /LENGTH=301 /DNA_ID=CAMNT_0007647951 /DNA_START=38 /DNA_END=943 /DNA_ORIENTATION=+
MGIIGCKLLTTGSEKKEATKGERFEEAKKEMPSGLEKYGPKEWKLRVELAAAYRIAAHMGWDEIIYNHISVRIIEPDGKEAFLINPFGLRFDEVTASSLLKVTADGKVIDPGSSDYGFNYAGFVIHGAIHDAREDINCIFHTHDKDMQAVSNMKCGLLPLSLESTSIGPVISKTGHPFQGITTDDAERPALIKALGEKALILFLNNHGTLACGKSIPDAFFKMFILARACSYQVVTMAAVGGDVSKLHLVDEKVREEKNVKKRLAGVAEKGGGREEATSKTDRTFYAMMRMMEQRDPSFMS